MKYLMLSPKEKKEKLVRATDLDALSCRASVNELSYFDNRDPYIEDMMLSYKNNLQFCSGYSALSAGRTFRSIFNEKKLPIINRGTYIRIALLDKVISQFIHEFGTCQIISLGGGTDTRCFNVLKNNNNVIYHELDFPESTKIKKLAILKNETLKKIIDYEGADIEVNSKEDFSNIPSDIHTSRYHLYGCDLRLLNEENEASALIQKYINKSLPTIILSECVLCYLSLKENECILAFWKKVLDHTKTCISILIYEPLSLRDSFGVTMTHNLSKRGIELPIFDKFPDLTSRFDLLKNNLGLNRVKITDMCNVGGFNMSDRPINPWISIEELRRINKLELIDELEEIILLLKHYCLCYGELSEGFKFNGINNWNWLIN